MTRMLDLFSGAGGAAMGYHRAGFDVTGIDINPQPNYPFAFIQADALDVLNHPSTLGYDAIHASPPCQRYSVMSGRHGRAESWPDLIGSVRDLLLATGVTYVIENVPGAPLIDPIVLCGSSFELGVRRHRLFESSAPLTAPPCDHAGQGRIVGVYGHTGGRSTRDGDHRTGVAGWRDAMGIDWMRRDELAQAIPPAYTEHIGLQLITQHTQPNTPKPTHQNQGATMSFWDDDEIKKAAEGGGYHKLTDIGDMVTGTIRKLNKRKFPTQDGGERTAIEIEFDDDTKFTAGQVLLLRDLFVLQPLPGEQLTVTLADVRKAGIKTTKLFRVELVRLDGNTDKIDQTSS